LAGFCVLALALTACEEERATGDVVGPLEGPRVAESLLALAVVQGAPMGITDVFEQGEHVHLWIHWTDLEPPHDVDVFWIDPSGDELPTSIQITDEAREQVTVFRLELTSVSELGRWEVEVYLDGTFQRSHLFYVVEFVGP
jgi:hypothetical protein